MARARIYTAPGESPDLQEILLIPAEVEEVERLDRIPDAGVPAVLFLSRGLLKGLSPEEWDGLPPHVVVLAADSQARGEARKAGRLFLSMEDFRGSGSSLGRVVRACLAHSALLLRTGSRRPPPPEA